jgi:hypothetical protein
VLGRHRLHPHRLPDAGGRRVPDARRVVALLAQRLAAGVGRVIDADDELLRAAAGLQRVRDVGGEAVVAALVRGDLVAVHIDRGLPVDGVEVQQQPLAVPGARHRERAPVPHPVLAPVDARQLGLDGERDDDALRQRPAERRRVAVLRGRELPRAVQVLPAVAHQLRPRVVRQRVAWVDALGPARGDLVLRPVVDVDVRERLQRPPVRVGDAALAVVADADAVAGLLGDRHRQLEHERRAAVAHGQRLHGEALGQPRGVPPGGPPDRPRRAADRDGEVARRARRHPAQVIGEVQR